MTRNNRVRANDWGTLEPSALGALEPRLSVSVVVPAYGQPEKLACTLAALSRQSYPAHLTEVVVVDDGSEPALGLPALRPQNTTITTTRDGSGPARAVAEGIRRSTGDVVLRLDSDMVPFHHHVEAHLRWHHLIDHAVVLGHKLFVDPDVASLDAAELAERVGREEGHLLFEHLPATPHQWVEDVWARTDDLRTAGSGAYTTHVGATASVSRALYEDAGGLDLSLTQGEDIELGYRLVQAGGVVIPERRAQSWHLGPTQIMRRGEEVNRFNAPFLADRISQLRWRRNRPGRTYTVPYVDVVVDATHAGYDAVVASVESVLASTVSDVRCVLVAPWSVVERPVRRPVDDEARDLRMLRAAFSGEARVVLAEHAPADAFPAAFLFDLPAGWRLGTTTLDTVLRACERDHVGLRRVLLANGAVATLTRTAALRRARRVATSGEDLVDVLDEVYGSWWSSGEEDGFRHHLEHG